MSEWKTTYAEKLAYGTMGADWQDRINWEHLRKEREAFRQDLISRVRRRVSFLSFFPTTNSSAYEA